MKHTSLLLLILIVCCSFNDGADKADLKAITAIKQEGFTNSKVMATLFHLTDVIGPRLTGSTAMKEAEEWTRQWFEGWGLQYAHIEPWGTFGKGWEIKHCYIAMIVPYYQPLIAIPRAWTPGTNGTIKAVAVAVKIETVQDMAQYAGKLKGKIVILSNTNEAKPNFTADAKRYTDKELQKMQQDPHVVDPEKNSNPQRPTVVLARQKIDSFLMEQGALATLAARGGSMGTVFTTNGASRAWDAKPTLPSLEMGVEYISSMQRLLRAGKPVTLEMNINTRFLTSDSNEYNVIAEIPGTDLKDEVVMLGAHLDSWHGSTGATDNAAGSAVVMEAIRIIKAAGLKPRRTIRIALWSGEEQGILGSRGYVTKHFGDRKTMKLKPEHQKISAYYNLDNGAGKIRGIYLQGNDATRPIFESWLAPFKDLSATTVTIRNTGSTDHIPFDAVGIPGFQFIQDPLEYGTRTHHTNMDSYDRVIENDLVQASVIMASVVYHTAMRDELMPRKPLPKAQ
jgi:carboxypeptidase Q